MHPNRAFTWEERGEMLDFVRRISFCTICAEGPAIAHAPVVVLGQERLLFHLSRANSCARLLDGSRAIVSCLGADSYISPDWYGTDDQVPTWNYVAVEAEGPVRQVEEAELADMLDRLSEEHESRLAPKPAWTRGKMTPGRFEAMLKAIVGFELRIDALRGRESSARTRKSPSERGPPTAWRRTTRPWPK
ncbi:FMN-binding negative transcriptional regulator [Sphingosinicella terrae]|uniref:FMN-binding negative transcriptional regulator n=1 Tax=Sphingosinicella terrae TaxID=2172047 RepID=UPI0025479CCD|nr:FMN-binding negative transcriptional regulator [Sphingosinicella terrae]